MCKKWWNYLCLRKILIAKNENALDMAYQNWYIWFMEYEVELLEDAVEFILSLPIKMQAKIQRTIGLLREFGYLLPVPHSKKIQGIEDLYELRVKLGSDICRLFYFYWKEKIYVITSGYVKKSKKTDKNQIARAVKLMKQFKEE